MTGYNLPPGVTQDALDRYLADIRRASMHAAPEDRPAIPRPPVPIRFALRWGPEWIDRAAGYGTVWAVKVPQVCAPLFDTRDEAERVKAEIFPRAEIVELDAEKQRRMAAGEFIPMREAAK